MKTYYWIMILLAAALIIVSVRLAYIGMRNAREKSPDAQSAVIDCIMTRTSVRSYSKEAVADSIIEIILKAGMAAPTAANQQAWEFVVVTDDSLKNLISQSFQYAKMVKDCAFAVVVCGNMDKLFKDDVKDGGFWTLDCSAASENMLLAAHALGLGGVWCGISPIKEREQTLAGILNLPSQLVPFNVLSFGYPAGKTTPKDKWKPSNIHYNAF